MHGRRAASGIASLDVCSAQRPMQRGLDGPRCHAQRPGGVRDAGIGKHPQDDNLALGAWAVPTPGAAPDQRPSDARPAALVDPAGWSVRAGAGATTTSRRRATRMTQACGRRGAALSPICQ